MASGDTYTYQQLTEIVADALDGTDNDQLAELASVVTGRNIRHIVGGTDCYMFEEVDDDVE
jgi:hypothetical protein